jgi:DNA-binding CsgD family transcriptional regulator
MRNPATQNSKRDLSSRVTDNDRPEDLLQRLVNRLAKTPGASPQLQTGNLAEEVILDLEIDGARYLLLRLPGTSQARAQLSPREHEIVRMVAMGYPNKIIADVLSISSWTVCTHLRRIFAKLGVGSRAAMVARLHELGRFHARTSLAQNAAGSRDAAREHQSLPSHRYADTASVACGVAAGSRRTS